jgi:hypothetical protein
MFPALFVALVLMLHPLGVFGLLSTLLVGMAFTHSIGVLYKSQEGTIANTTDPFTGNAEEGLDVNVPAATTAQAEALAITVANLVSLCLFSTTTAVVIKTYAAGVLKDTINLAAGKQLVWNNASTFANPFSVNFDTIKLDNADPTKATTFKARFLLSD